MILKSLFGQNKSDMDFPISEVPSPKKKSSETKVESDDSKHWKSQVLDAVKKLKKQNVSRSDAKKFSQKLNLNSSQIKLFMDVVDSVYGK